MKTRRNLLTAMLVLCFAVPAMAQYSTYDVWDENYTVQALLGAVQYEDLKFDVDDVEDGTSAEVDVSLIPQFGGAWGTLPKGDRFHYGLECSFLLGLRIKDVNYLYLGGEGAVASLSTSMWMFDLAGGPYAGLYLDKGRRVRLYIAGGPSMMYAAYNYDTDYPDTGPGDTPEDTSEGESAFGIGAYARAGFEFRIYEKGMLGLGARGSWSSVDFSDVGGTTDLFGGGVFVTFTAGL